MTQTQATAEVFLTAFNALTRVEQSRVIVGMIRDRRLREELVDLARAESRSHEPHRPFSQFLRNHQKRRKK